MSHLLATPRGITLAGVILAKRNSNGSFAIKGHQKYIHAQLQAAYGKAVTPQAMRYVVRGCELLAKVSDKELEEAAYPFHPNPHAKTTSGNDFSDLTKGLMMFALTGLNDMENIAQGKARLLKIQASIHHDSLLKSYGLPSTRNWVEGEEITGPNQPALATGTAIATFDEDGNYPQGNVPKHAAIFVSYTDNGIIVYDQWAGQPPHIRTITFDNAKLPQNNAYSYSVIMTKK
jgi:hypothetical protein